MAQHGAAWHAQQATAWHWRGSTLRTVEWVIFAVAKASKTARARGDDNVTIAGELLKKISVPVHHFAAPVRQAMSVGNDGPLPAVLHWKHNIETAICEVQLLDREALVRRFERTSWCRGAAHRECAKEDDARHNAREGFFRSSNERDCKHAGTSPSARAELEMR